MTNKKILRVGIIGCGEVAQVSHIPNFNFMPQKFKVTYLCDVSQKSLNHCRDMVRGADVPKTTKNPEELCASPDVDVVLICTADEYHVHHGCMALKNDKWTLIEKPLAQSFRDLETLLEAERRSKGRVFVGTMRRYAPAFLEAVEEVGGMDKIMYARVRSIIGPNFNFINQSCTFPVGPVSDIAAEDLEDRQRRHDDIMHQALAKEFGVAVTEDSIRQFKILGSLNTHDLSAMREIIGMPKRCLGASLGFPGIYTALLQYDTFPVTFESGINGVPTFDANIEVYAEDKIVRIQYDTPYVKGLPVTMTVREKVPSRTREDASGFQERVVRRTYEDPFTLEMLEFWECVVNGKPIKSSAEDARGELELWKMILQAGEHTYNDAR
ncbi:oxidoreductase family, NAD-binding rossmann fold domain-containing protein [Sarocladium implicatum]|nr:oxidoreductase family, NAD-binding rossmann fold domain-containing protein [Sarocladium implicatum]